MSDFKPGDKKYCTPMCVDVCDELRLTGLVIRANLCAKKLKVRLCPEIPMSIYYYNNRRRDFRFLMIGHETHGNVECVSQGRTPSVIGNQLRRRF